MTWEYKALDTRGPVMALGAVSDAESELTALLNDLGSEGWEAFGQQGGWFFMKRPRDAGEISR
jgi:hypothetical protein